jgi:flagellar biosynthesis protein FlhF
MSELPSQTANTPPGIERGKKYRFVVKSAEEAISTLRERLGMDAKVISVRQMGGEGLGRFLSSPKLEIVAMLPEAEIASVPAPASARAQKAPRKGAAAEIAAESENAPAVDPQRNELDSEIAADAAPAPRRARAAYGRQGAGVRAPTNVWTLLRNAGFDDNLLGSLRYDAGSDAEKLDDMPLSRALGEVNRRLRLEYQAIEARPVTGRMAFFGTPGVGKTTALCKRLANDVFINRKSVEVLKLDSDTPNPDDALCLFCDVLGVPLQRDGGQKSIETQADTLYVDLPGMPIDEKEQWSKLRQRLDILGVGTRVLVVNGMYEAALIGGAFDLGERMGATHLAVTHIDEMSGAAKLWPYVLRGRLSPLFASHGQNVTSDYSEDMLRILLEKTFPSNVIDG